MTSSPTGPQALLPRRPPPRLLSLVIPVFNEEESLPRLRTALDAWWPTLAVPGETILVDDGSMDGSAGFLREWAGQDRRVKVVFLSRNFGHQAAVSAGLEFAEGEAVVILDADLQDPLEVIPAFLEHYQAGFDVVYGRRGERLGEGWFKRVTASLFYRFMRAFVQENLPSDTGDFRLISRAALLAIRQLPERHRFLRGLFTWIGFPQAEVAYTRQPRRWGRTKYPLRKMVRFAWNATLSFSTFPITVIALSGFAIAGFGFAYGIYTVLRWLFTNDSVPGWTTLVVLQAMLGGMILVSLGIIGEYVGRIYEEVKGRPLYIVRQAVNCASPGDPETVGWNIPVPPP